MRRSRRSISIILAVIVTLAGTTANTISAEIYGADGIVLYQYDDSIWAATIDATEQPQFACSAETCGGDTADCGVGVVRRDIPDHPDASFLDRFRQNLDKRTLEFSTVHGAAGSAPEIILPASIRIFGGNVGVHTSLRIMLGEQASRVDNFWVLVGTNLAGITCVIAESDYERARPAFERLYTDLAIGPP